MYALYVLQASETLRCVAQRFILDLLEDIVRDNLNLHVQQSPI